MKKPATELTIVFKKYGMRAYSGEELLRAPAIRPRMKPYILPTRIIMPLDIDSGLG